MDQQNTRYNRPIQSIGSMAFMAGLGPLYPPFNYSLDVIWDESLMDSTLYRNLFQVNFVDFTPLLTKPQLTLAMFCGFILAFNGFQMKQGSNKVMVYVIVTSVCCLFAIISKADWLIPGGPTQVKADQTRISAEVIKGAFLHGQRDLINFLGVGFLGSGFLIKSGTELVSGMKKGAILWSAASIGLAIGYQYYIISCYAVFLLQVRPPQ